MLTEAPTPIELPDDGLRVVASGELRGFRFVSKVNPELVAIACYASTRRRQLLSENLQHIS